MELTCPCQLHITLFRQKLAMPISDQLKDAIRNSGMSVSQIARDTGITQPTLSRFISEHSEQHRDIRLEATADKLAEYFGLVLKKERKK